MKVEEKVVDINSVKLAANNPRVEIAVDELEPEGKSGTLLFNFTDEGLIIDVVDEDGLVIGTMANEYHELSFLCVDLAPIVEQCAVAKEQYLQHRGCRCYYCGSGDMEPNGPYYSDDDFTTWPVRCNNCGGQWKDVQLLADVIDLEDPTKYFDKPEGWR